MGLMTRISGAMGGIAYAYRSMFGSGRDQSNIDLWRDGESAPPGNPIVSNPYPPPFQGPQDLDPYGRESNEMRLAYQRYYASEPTFQSAIDGKVAAIASLDASVQPADENAEGDKRAAQFVRDAVANAPGGWSGLIRNILTPAFVTGYSITEKWMRGVDDDLAFDRLRPRWSGFWAPKRLASIDTNYLRLQFDETRQVIGVINTRRGLEGYTPDRVLIYTHRKLFENPYGRSDGRSAYRACQMIENAYKLWYIAIKNYAAPYITVKTKATGAVLAKLKKALEAARSGGWLTLTADDEANLLNFATATSFQAFEQKVRISREEIYLAVRGAYLPFLEGSQTDARGDTQVHKVASDAIESLLVQDACEVVNQQLIQDLVRPNFGDRVGLPSLSLGGTNWNETKTQLEVATKLVNEMGIPVSKAWAYKISQCEPPRDEGDAVKPKEPPQPPQPGMGGGFPFSDQPLRVIHQHAPALPVAAALSGGVSESFAAPGPPPHPGLVWKEETHRWVLPPSSETGTSQYKPHQTPAEDASKKAHDLIQEHHANQQMKDVHSAFVAASQGTLSPMHIAAAADRVSHAEGGAAEKPAATFSDSVDDEADADPPDAPVAGQDGQAAMRLAQQAMQDGRKVLESITRDAVARRLAHGTGPLFNPDELTQLAESIASATATAELLGRYRIREQAEQSTAAGRRFARFDSGTNPNRIPPLPPAKALEYFRDLMPSLSALPDFDGRHHRLSFTLAAHTGDVIQRQIQDAIAKALTEGRTGTYAVQDLLDQAGVSVRNPQYCFAPDTIVEGNVLAASKAWYDGPIAKVQTDDGRCLSVTVNHPVLTTGGWKRAGDLKQGDDLICYGSRIEPLLASGLRDDGGERSQLAIPNGSPSVGPNSIVGTPSQGRAIYDQHAPSRIEDVYESLAGKSSARHQIQSPVSPLDFYGDATFFKSQISCVWTDRELENGSLSTCGECGQQIRFMERDISPAESSAQGVGLLDFGFDGPFDAGLAACEWPQYRSLLLGGNASPPMAHAFGMASQLDPGLFHCLDKRLGGDAKLASDLIDRLPAEVSSHRVIKIERVAFSGHVYDLQTTTGFIVSQGIITSNCDMVFRTNAIDAFNAGHDDERQAPDVIDEFPVWEYLGIRDGRQGKDHEPHFGKFFPASASFAQVRGERPFNCRCSSRAVSRREWARNLAAGAVLESV